MKFNTPFLIIMLALGLSGCGGNPVKTENVGEKSQVQGFSDRFEIKGKLRGDALISASDDWETSFRSRSSYIKLSAQLTKNIKAVVGIKLSQYFLQKGDWDVSDFPDVEKFISDAYIEIKNIGGQPVAVIVGKHEIAWGQDISKLMYHDNKFHSISERNEIIGVTVALEPNFFKMIADKVEISVFESISGAGDLDIGTFDSVAVRLTKKLTKQLTVRLSGLYSGDGDNDAQYRGSLGLVYKTKSGWTAWFEGIYFDNHPKFADSEFAVTAGVSKTFGPGEAVVELVYINNSILQLTAGYNIHVTGRISVSPEVRYSMFEEEAKDDTLVIGVRTVVNIGTKPKKLKNPLFGK